MLVDSIACFGEAMIELSLDGDDASTAKIGFAGDTLNTAIYLKRAAPQVDVAYVTRIGCDRFSEKMLRFVKGEKIDTSCIGMDDERMPGLYAISTSTDGERSFSYWRDRSAARELFDVGSPSFEDLSRFGMIYFSAISLAVLTDAARSALRDWIPGYRGSGGLVAFDSNYRPALWKDAETARREIDAFWRLTDCGLPSVDDEQEAFGDSDAEAVLSRIRACGVRFGALKRGPLGPVAIEEDVEPQTFSPAEKVVDTTAAGDSFNGAYLAAFLTGGIGAQCLRAGHDLASRVVGARGAILPRES
jgi:2-dehydro-3-deoxygluconokinase